MSGELCCDDFGSDCEDFSIDPTQPVEKYWKIAFLVGTVMKKRKFLTD